MDAADIRAFPAFAELPATELDALAETMTEVGVEAGVQVVTLDEYGTALERS